MTDACRHGQTETHPNGSIRCGKCGKWASIDRQAALEAKLSVGQITEALHELHRGRNAHVPCGYGWIGPDGIYDCAHLAAALHATLFVASEEKP